ncbi:hypothetical protein CDD82_6255 [Ophiocordyceps australis]|uniref:Cation efflux protein transmembrane domain-containing protein n=1 Tax=Ophiocordyceps australis TaxID=1399860 RepID=A0A2C5ZRA5_9HYPO|nr:hypothetical protein CDD82_6255 [Ophiocordyceps australis]
MSATTLAARLSDNPTLLLLLPKTQRWTMLWWLSVSGVTPPVAVAALSPAAAAASAALSRCTSRLPLDFSLQSASHHYQLPLHHSQTPRVPSLAPPPPPPPPPLQLPTHSPSRPRLSAPQLPLRLLSSRQKRPASLSIRSRRYHARHHIGDAQHALITLNISPVRRRVCPLVIVMSSHPQQQKREHGHAGQHHDNAYLVSANKNDSGVRITRIGLLANLSMAVAKFVGGWTFNSKSMVADGWHSITDLASDVLTLATVSWSLKPPTDRFPMGYGKIESLGSLGVSSMLLIGGLYMGWESAISLYGHFNPEAAHVLFEHIGHGHSHSHGAADLGVPSIHAAWLAAGTILVKEWLYRATMKVARERKSSVLASNAVHHRIDSLTGIVTLAAILGANVLENAAWLDPVGGLLISIMVVNAGLGNTRAALCELADQSIDKEIKAAIRKQSHRALANVALGHEAQVRQISGIKSGQNYLIDVEIAVPASWKVEALCSLEDAVRTQVGAKVRGVRRVRVRFVSSEAAAQVGFDEFIPGSVLVESDPESDCNDDDKHGKREANAKDR